MIPRECHGNLNLKQRKGIMGSNIYEKRNYGKGLYVVDEDKE